MIVVHDAAVGADGDIHAGLAEVFVACGAHLNERGGLAAADTLRFARDADGAAADADFDKVRAALGEEAEAVAVDDIARGKTEWAILGPEQKIIRFGDSGFPKDYPFPAETAIPEKLQRFHEKFEDADLFSHYAVRSTDIDLGHHMNNVAYVRLLLDCFSAKELASGNIQSVELHYSTPCFEGEALTVYKKSLDDGTCRIGIVKPDGKTASQACVTFKK